MNKVRLILAVKDLELINRVKTSLARRPLVDTILTVTRPIEAENKIDRNGINILLWDLDEFKLDRFWMQQLQSRHMLYIIFTSLASGSYLSVPKSGKEEFLQKPAVFTNVTALRFCSTLESQMDGLVKRQRPPSMRDWVKMIDPNSKQKIIAVGSSTGGTNALELLLKTLPPDVPPMVIVQHMPSGFTKLFADRLNAIYRQDIREAQSGDFLMRGRVLIAPADKHMRIIRQQGKLAVECYIGNRIHGVMPAADILFESIADVVKGDAVGVILTGMGNDGAKGLLRMKNAGCKTIGQDEATCVVYGMPKAAKALGAVDHELPLDKIPEMILHLASK
ncbi:MAG: CheB methylesterase domain-containing protein [Defluviitaleaceae bacterium]|nr:CheB methylesterase domain-containing protein [Defluviitaleaceae bacterium]